MSSFDRICWLCNRLKKNRRPTRQSYMNTFEVSESTFKRDIALMRDRMGAPLEYDPESTGGRRGKKTRQNVLRLFFLKAGFQPFQISNLKFEINNKEDA
jgi:predicted DNA-binding transcriptional regulator YafY